MIGEVKKDSFLTKLKKSKFLPFGWITFAITYQFIVMLCRSNRNLSQRVVYGSIRKRRIFGIWETDYDCKDRQWNHFRNILIPLSIFFGFYLLLSTTVKTYVKSFKKRKLIFLVIELVFIYYLHGIYIFWILLFLSINFSFTYLLSLGNFKIMTSLTWIFPIVLLFFNEYYEEKYDMIIKYIPRNLFFIRKREVYSFVVGFNMLILRMISFNIDYYLSVKGIDFLKEKSKRSKKNFGSNEQDFEYYETKPTVDNFTNKNLKLEFYTFTNYLVYAFYPPLYVAGPISSFNNFISWFNLSPLKRKNSQTIRNILYFVRFLFSFVCLELYNSHLFVTSINSQFYLLEGKSSVTEWLFLGLGTVFYIFLKFNTIWKYFRMVSMLDGIEVYENMGGCIGSQSSVRSFWRDWHSSFYKWNVRYIYLFLGGNENSFRNSILIFVFVSVWHDIHLNLLIYGWAIIVVFIVEDLTMSLFHKHFPKRGPDKVWYHPILRVIRIWMFQPLFIVIINIGFTGLSQSFEMLKAMLSFRGVFDLLVYLLLLFVGQGFVHIIRSFTGKKTSYRNEY